MATKYSKRDRALAMRLCQIAACGGVWVGDVHSHWQTSSLTLIARALGLNENSKSAGIALYLAASAWVAVHDATRPGDLIITDAEAECLLRDGWSPGDPIVRLKEQPC